MASRLLLRPGSDGLAAVLLRRDIVDGLGELPPMTCQILDCEFALAVLAIDGWLQDPGAVSTGALVLGRHVINANLDFMGQYAGKRRLPDVTGVGDDHCAAVANAH